MTEITEDILIVMTLSSDVFEAKALLILINLMNVAFMASNCIDSRATQIKAVSSNDF
ncbi:hypothetical protein [Pseudoalteromonas sp. MMG012]|uniref:hypothetical protein n=1 Tax=Pseudoalteromonas sp. MMG012 TaxID=2822686 RepID=UPI001B3A1B28|nr:hypothetical protein [Pseudoalteromonas sp. MMG012]MBQ4852806.1 hypothetical protein [Pseudoalteromonas sp. MMG012]